MENKEQRGLDYEAYPSGNFTCKDSCKAPRETQAVCSSAHMFFVKFNKQELPVRSFYLKTPQTVRVSGPMNAALPPNDELRPGCQRCSQHRMCNTRKKPSVSRGLGGDGAVSVQLISCHQGATLVGEAGNG